MRHAARYTTGIHDGTCTWQEGGNFVPGTIDHFVGSANVEYGRLLRVAFPEAGFTTSDQFEDFNSGDLRNASPVGPVFH